MTERQVQLINKDNDMCLKYRVFYFIKIVFVFILFIYFFSDSYSQWSVNNYWYSTSNTNKVNYNNRANDFFKRVSNAGVTLTDIQKGWYNDSIFVPLYNAGIIGNTRAGDSLVFLYAFVKFANNSETVAKYNLLDNSYNCININGVTFTDSGAFGNGTTTYLNTLFNPTLDSNIYRLNSASFGLYLKSTTSSGRFGLQGTSGGFSVIILGSLSYYSNVNYDGNSYNQLSTFTNGFISFTRLKNNFSYYTSNASIVRDLINQYSFKIPNGYFCLFAQYYNGVTSGFNSNICSFSFVGSGLSETKMIALRDILNNSLKGRKYNVY